MARGERTIQLPNDEEVTVLFTTFALADAEQKMGKSVLGVARGFLNNEAGVLETAQLLRAGWTASNRAAGLRKESVSLQDAYSVIDKAGFPQVMTAVLEAMSEVLMYDGKSGKNDEPDPN
jgi:hypothetical protein